MCTLPDTDALMQVYYDPLTGKRLGAGMGEDSEEDEKPAAKQPIVAHIPSSTIHSFAGAPKADALVKKLRCACQNILVQEPYVAQKRPADRWVPPQRAECAAGCQRQAE